MTLCAEEDIALIPYGGGSSVVGGINAVSKSLGGAILTLDTTLLTRVIQIDKVSMTARIEAGIYGPHLEEQLHEPRRDARPLSADFQYSTLGGWVAARGAGQQSNRYGKAEKWLVSAKLATPKGFWTTEGTPASAAGPNLNQLVAGSEGTLGVIVEATVKIHDLPERKDYRGYLFKSFAAGVEAARRINHAEIPVAREQPVATTSAGPDCSRARRTRLATSSRSCSAPVDAEYHLEEGWAHDHLVGHQGSLLPHR